MVIRRIDDLGRLQLPKDYRKTLDIHEGDELVIELKDGYMSVKKEEKKIGEEGMERIVMEGTPLTLEERLERQANEIRTKEQQIEQLKAENDHWQEVCADLHIEYGEQTEAQQQEIDRLKDRNVTYVNENANQAKEIERLNEVLDDWKYNAKCDADHIAGLLADKDEQAAKIMRLMEALEEAAEEIENIYGHDTPQTEKYRELLGGAEDGKNTQA